MGREFGIEAKINRIEDALATKQTGATGRFLQTALSNATEHPHISLMEALEIAARVHSIDLSRQAKRRV